MVLIFHSFFRWCFSCEINISNDWNKSATNNEWRDFIWNNIADRRCHFLSRVEYLSLRNNTKWKAHTIYLHNETCSYSWCTSHSENFKFQLRLVRKKKKSPWMMYKCTFVQCQNDVPQKLFVFHLRISLSK